MLQCSYILIELYCQLQPIMSLKKDFNFTVEVIVMRLWYVGTKERDFLLRRGGSTILTYDKIVVTSDRKWDALMIMLAIEGGKLLSGQSRFCVEGGRIQVWGPKGGLQDRYLDLWWKDKNILLVVGQRYLTVLQLSVTPPPSQITCCLPV